MVPLIQTFQVDKTSHPSLWKGKHLVDSML